jgi:hypothetical protein
MFWFGIVPLGKFCLVLLFCEFCSISKNTAARNTDTRKSIDGSKDGIISNCKQNFVFKRTVNCVSSETLRCPTCQRFQTTLHRNREMARGDESCTRWVGRMRFEGKMTLVRVDTLGIDRSRWHMRH